MAYSKELIDEIRELYQDYPKMVELAESGSVWLGRYLNDSCPMSISINDVLLATSLDDLKKTALLYKRKNELYGKWCKEDPRRKNF